MTLYADDLVLTRVCSFFNPNAATVLCHFAFSQVTCTAGKVKDVTFDFPKVELPLVFAGALRVSFVSPSFKYFLISDTLEMSASVIEGGLNETERAKAIPRASLDVTVNRATK